MQAEFAADLFDGVTIERLLGHLQVLLAGAVAAPGESPRGPAGGWAELHQLLREWNDTAHPVAPACIHEIFEQRAARDPAAARR